MGYRDDPAQAGGGVFIFRNTARAGLDGLMPYAYARAYMNDAAWIDDTPAARPPEGAPNSPEPDRPSPDKE